MRHGVRPRHSSILPPSFHKRNKRSICQRARCKTITSQIVSMWAGTLVIKMVHFARLNTFGLATFPLRLARLSNPFLALGDHFFWHPHHPLPPAMTHFGANLLQIEFLPTLRLEETRSFAGTRQKKPLLRFEPVQTAIAFISDVEHASRDALLTQWTALISVPTVRQERPLQATTLEVPPHMQLESSFALPLPASASLPDVFELVRQFDRRTVFHDHRLKAP